MMNRLGRQVLIPGALASSMPRLKEQSKYYESGLLKISQFEPFRSESKRLFRDGHQEERKLRLRAGMVNAGVSALYTPMGRALGIGRTRCEVGETCGIQSIGRRTAPK